MKVAIDTPMIKLNQLLKYTGLVETGGQAKQLILAKKVRLNGEICTVIRKQVFPGDLVELMGEQIEVIQS